MLVKQVAARCFVGTGDYVLRKFGVFQMVGLQCVQHGDGDNRAATYRRLSRASVAFMLVRKGGGHVVQAGWPGTGKRHDDIAVMAGASDSPRGQTQGRGDGTAKTERAQSCDWALGVLVGRAWLEHATNGLKVRCSTN